MAFLRPRAAACVLVVVDLQPKFLAPIHEGDRVLSRVRFLCECATILGVPIIASEQVPQKMGHTDERILAAAPGLKPIGKTTFGCCETPALMNAFDEVGRPQVILVGIETHICVSQTGLGMLDRGFDVAVCPDAVSSRTLEQHKLGMERIRDAGIAPIHSEAVVYEWLESADHPRFRDVLEVVKRNA